MALSEYQTTSYVNSSKDLPEKEKICQNSLSSQHFCNILNSLEISVTNLPDFSSKLLTICPAISPPIRFLMSVEVISLLLLIKFPKFSWIQENMYVNFYHIKRLLVNFTHENYEVTYNESMSLLYRVRSFIESMIGQNLSADLVFTMLTCAELFKNLQSFPLELIISVVNNCVKISNSLDGTSGYPSIYSLICNEVSPYLPEYSHKDFTLVLDLDETLGHYRDGKFLLRPGVQSFIAEMNQHFELVLFTAASRVYADWAMESVDPHGLVLLRLYQQHTDGRCVKDLTKLGRDINKTVIIDNFSKCFEQQPDNGIEISPWIGDNNDCELTKIGKNLALLPYCKIKKLKMALVKLNLC